MNRIPTTAVLVLFIAVIVVAAVSVSAASNEDIANECQACKTSLTALQDKAVSLFASAKYKKASGSDHTRRELLESGVNKACDEFKGWATTGVDKDLKYMKFGGTIGGGMSLTNLSMGPHVDAQLKKACKKLWDGEGDTMVDALIKVKRVYDADLSDVCNAGTYHGLYY